MLAKPALAYTHPLVFAFYREICSGPLLALLGFIVERMPPLDVRVASSAQSPLGARPQLSDWWRFFLLGLTGVWGNQLFIFLGLYFTSPIQGMDMLRAMRGSVC